MNERFLFRGIRVDNGEWVEGFFEIITKGFIGNYQNGYNITTFKKLDNGEIILTGMFEVDPATVGQCTGLKDKNGKLIFEGDIVAEKNSIGNAESSRSIDELNKEYTEIGRNTRWIIENEIVYTVDTHIVRWEFKSCGFEPFSDSIENCQHCGGGINPNETEIIGNIHDNKDLL